MEQQSPKLPSCSSQDGSTSEFVLIPRSIGRSPLKVAVKRLKSASPKLPEIREAAREVVSPLLPPIPAHVSVSANSQLLGFSMYLQI